MTKGKMIEQVGFGWVWDGKFYGTFDAAIADRDRANEPDKPQTWGEWVLWDQDEGWEAFQALGEVQTADDTAGDVVAYRIRIEPVRDTVTLTGAYLNATWSFSPREIRQDTHRLTLPALDGQPISGTYTNDNGDKIVMEAIGDE